MTLAYKYSAVCRDMEWFVFLIRNIDCGTGTNGVLTCTHNQCFDQKYKRYQFLMKFSIFTKSVYCTVKFSSLTSLIVSNAQAVQSEPRCKSTKIDTEMQELYINKYKL